MGIGGWPMIWFMEKIGTATSQKPRKRIAAELKTTFTSRYSNRVTQVEVLSPETIRTYSRHAIRERYLLTLKNGNGQVIRGQRSLAEHYVQRPPSSGVSGKGLSHTIEHQAQLFTEILCLRRA
jgi:hypothetical protein